LRLPTVLRQLKRKYIVGISSLALILLLFSAFSSRLSARKFHIFTAKLADISNSHIVIMLDNPIPSGEGTMKRNSRLTEADVTPESIFNMKRRQVL